MHGTDATPGRVGAVLRAAGDPGPCPLGRHGPWVATTLAQARAVLTDPRTYDFPVDVSRRAVRRREAGDARSPHELLAPLSHDRAALAADVFTDELDRALAGSTTEPDAMVLLRHPVARSTVEATLPGLSTPLRDRLADGVLGWVDALGPVISSSRPVSRWSRARRAEDAARSHLAALLVEAGDDAPARTATVLAAGTQVPIAAGAWMLVELAAHPDVAAQLREGRVEPLSVVWEVLRVAPPTWVTARVTRGPTELGGVRLPEGAVVLVSPLLLGRLEALVPAGTAAPEDDRARFDPGRWASGAVRPGAWLPFGAGPHACPGRHVGLAQLVRLALWAREQRLELTGPVHLDQSRGIFPRPAHVAIRDPDRRDR